MKRDDFFRYGDKETEYLKRRDKRLAEVIEKVGKIERTVIPDLFAALVHSIVGQQISTRAHETIWARMKHGLREITPQARRRTATVRHLFQESGLYQIGSQENRLRRVRHPSPRDLAGRRSLRQTDGTRGSRRVDGRNADDILHAASRRIQLPRSGDHSRTAHDLPSPQHRPD